MTTLRQEATFAVLDVETANYDRSSICQIGIVQFVNGTINQHWNALINPDDFFDEWHVMLHGISEKTVANAPSFPEVVERLHGFLTSGVVASHTSFDQTSMRAIHNKYQITPPHITWLDTASVVRRAWPERAAKGYGLDAVSEMLGIEFRHHDAEEDARAAGEVLLRAIEKTGLSVQEWLLRVKKPIFPTGKREANPDGPLFGEVAVFTGALLEARTVAASKAAAIGCRVDGGITKQTTLLIVGDQDLARLDGHSKSRKHRKAENLITGGQNIQILKESDFNILVEQSSYVDS